MIFKMAGKLLRGIFTLVFIAAVVLAGWYYRAELRGAMGWISQKFGWAGEEVVMEGGLSETLAAETERVWRSAAAGSGPDTVRLTSEQVQSWVRFSLPAFLPPGVENVAVALGDSTLTFSGRIDFAALEQAYPQAAEGRRMFGDSLNVSGELSHTVDAPGAGRANVLRVSPIPGLMLPLALRELGAGIGLEVAGTSVATQVPETFQNLTIQDSAVVIRRRP